MIKPIRFSIKNYHSRKQLKIFKCIILFYNKFKITKDFYIELGIRIKKIVIFITIKTLWN